MSTGFRKEVECGVKESLTKNSHTVDENFKELKIYYLRFDKGAKVSEHFEQSTVVFADFCRFVDVVLQKRSLENNNFLLVELEVDGGIASSKYACQFLTWTF